MNPVLSVVFVASLFSSAKFCFAGTNQYHRETSLDELKNIDSLVSTGLPLFSNGFFINTGRGPVLVKKGNNDDKAPRLNPGYYRTLPRLIPQGYGGIATSVFNLGSAFPVQQVPFRPDGTQQPLQVPVAPVSAPVAPQGQNFQYQQQYYNRGPPTAPVTYEEQQQPQQSQNYQTYYQSPEIQQQQEPINVPQQQQQRPFQQQQQQRLVSQVQRQQPQHQSPVAQDTFQIDNFLTPGEEPETPTSYQRTEFGHEQFVSHKFIRNPVVERAVAVDETLPEGLKNPFYRNEQLASALAQESLPVPGEEVVGEWDTTKIQKSKIHELLRGAGLI